MTIFAGSKCATEALFLTRKLTSTMMTCRKMVLGMMCSSKWRDPSAVDYKIQIQRSETSSSNYTRKEFQETCMKDSNT